MRVPNMKLSHFDTFSHYYYQKIEGNQAQQQQPPQTSPIQQVTQQVNKLNVLFRME